MSSGYELGMRDAAPDTSFVFLTPDSVWSSGSFDALKRLVTNGYRAVMVSGPRVNLEGFVPEFIANGGMNGITARRLSWLLEKHLHKSFRAFMFGQPFHNTHPAALYWQVEGGLVARHFVQHPLLVRPRKPVRVVEETIDYNIAAFVRRSEVYVCRDSDEILGVDLGEQDSYQGIVRRGPLSDEHVVNWLQSEWPTRFHKWLGRHTIHFHSEDIGPQHLAAALEAEATVRRIYRRIPPLGFIYTPRSTVRGMLMSAPTKSKAPWHRKVRQAVRAAVEETPKQAVSYVLMDSTGDSFRRVGVPDAASELRDFADFPQLEGSKVAPANDEGSARQAGIYALVETAEHGFHRISLRNVAMLSEAVNVISVEVRPETRTRLRVELMGEGPSDYCRADFDLLTGEIAQFQTVGDARIEHLARGWHQVSFSMKPRASRGVVSIDLLDDDGAVNYKGIAGVGMTIGLPRLSSK
jgi:hypothetical protein